MPAETHNKTKATLTIQEMARESGLSEHTLRYYEQIGLLTPVPRDFSSGHRRYSAETVSLIETLTCLRGTGMSIADMRRFLQLRRQGVDAAAELKALFGAYAAVVAADMDRMETRRRYLAGKAAYWAAVEKGDAELAQEIGKANRQIAKTMADEKETQRKKETR